MQRKKIQNHYRIVLEFSGGLTRTCSVKASTREIAEARALKRNPSATGVKRA